MWICSRGSPQAEIAKTMAYYTHLFAVPLSGVRAFQQDRTLLPEATRSVVCSHLIASGVGPPWGNLLKEALDGGQVLHQELRHPFRPPSVHPPEAVAVLAPKLKAASESAAAQALFDEGDWTDGQIGQVVELFEWAHRHGEAVVSFLGGAKLQLEVADGTEGRGSPAVKPSLSLMEQFRKFRARRTGR